MTLSLMDKAIMITGAGSGLGAATARACARAGARLYLVDRDKAGLDILAGELTGMGAAAGSFVGDLSDRGTCRNAVREAIRHLGRLDGLCNVAGITLFHRVGDVTDADWDRTFAILLTAPFVLSQAALPELIRNKGSILNVASSGGIKGTAYTVPYSSAKAALIHMTRCMAMEFINEPVRINAIAPGGMMTNIMRGNEFPEGLDRALIERYAGIRPPVGPEEVASLIVYMLSDATPYLHGSVVSVDGGVTAG